MASFGADGYVRWRDLTGDLGNVDMPAGDGDGRVVARGDRFVQNPDGSVTSAAVTFRLRRNGRLDRSYGAAGTASVAAVDGRQPVFAWVGTDRDDDVVVVAASFTPDFLQRFAASRYIG